MPASDGQLTAAELAQISALVVALSRQRQVLQATAVAAAVAPLKTITGLADWFSSSTSNAYITKVLRTVQPAQVRMARLTDAYHARVLSIMAGQRVNSVGAVDVTKLRRAITTEQARQIVAALPATYDFAPSRPVTTISAATTTAGTTLAPQTVARVTTAAATGTNTAVVPRATTAAANTTTATVDPGLPYGRIFDQARYNITARGLQIEQVAAAAAARAAHVASTDVMLAGRAQSRQTMRERGVERYRRVLRPYKGQGGPVCGLCIVAADRIYHIEDLLPIHNNCRCEVVAVGSAADPGKTLNDDDLRTLYAAAGGTGAGGLLNVKAAISEHGELGPVLSYATQKRRGITEVAVSSGADPNATRKAQLASYEKSIVGLRERVAAGEDTAKKALAFQENRIDELRRELADVAA